MQNQCVQILFPSALGPRATAQNGINWDYWGFGCLAATQGWMLNVCLSELDSCLIKLPHSGHCLPRTFLSKEWLQVVLFCDRLLALIQCVALMDCCNTTFLSEITKSTNKYNGFSSHLSELFLWYQNVNRCDCSRVDRMDVELLLDKRKEHLENIHWAETLRFRASHLLLATYSCELKDARWQAQAESPELAETGPRPSFPVLFLQGCARIDSRVRWRAQPLRCVPDWATLCYWRDGTEGQLFFYWDSRTFTNLNWCDSFSPFDWLSCLTKTLSNFLIDLMFSYWLDAKEPNWFGQIFPAAWSGAFPRGLSNTLRSKWALRLHNWVKFSG